MAPKKTIKKKPKNKKQDKELEDEPEMIMDFEDDPVPELKQEQDLTPIPQTDYTTFMFGNKTVKLNDEQYNVVMADKTKSILVVACAGSGKTTVICCKIKYLIDHGVPPERIIFVSFNVDAAQSIKNRLTELYGVIPHVHCSTIDSLACHFYYKYFKKTGYVGVNEYATYLLEFLRSDKGHMITDNYDYFFLDEMQDVNPVKFDIFKHFYDAGKVVTGIGDDAQNIYSYIDSSSKFILKFHEYIPNHISYKLVNNYRSTPEIVELANCSIRKNTDQIPKDMISNIPSINEKPTLQHYNDDFIQASNIINKILGYVQQGVPYEEIAIISRNNKPLKIFEEQLEKSRTNIPYVALITDNNIETKPKISKGHITLTTIHKSKGLEWNVVFLVSCDDYIFPMELDNVSIQEERRLFYVAVTRAKRYLNISFTGYTVTRFMVELNPNLYRFIGPRQDRFFKINNNRTTKIELSVCKIIEMINEKDIKDLRSKNIIPDMLPVIEKVHDPSVFHNSIDKYFLHQDYGSFIDRYITRQIGRIQPESGGLVDTCVQEILSCLEIDSNLYKIYTKYQVNYQLQLRLITPDTLKDDYFDIISSGMLEINPKDNKQVFTIMCLIIDRAFQINTSPANILVFPTNFIPESFFSILAASYKKFTSGKQKNLSILKDIYNVSISSNIRDGRRRLVYKDVSDVFLQDTQIFENINSYINSIKQNKLICKKKLYDTDREILGELDLLDSTNNTLIDFKCSTTSECKLEWIMQLLAYTSLLNLENIKIDTIKIYNPLIGNTVSFDVSNWNKQKELLDFMEKVRDRQMNRNKNVLTVK